MNRFNKKITIFFYSETFQIDKILMNFLGEDQTDKLLYFYYH